MKLSNLSKVNDLTDTKTKCEQAIEDLLQDQIDHVGENYNFNLSNWSDGSGSIANLNGCYVRDEVIASTIEILKSKIITIENQLIKLGVEV